MTVRLPILFLGLSALAAPAAAADPTIAELQRQIDELKAVVEQLKAAQRAGTPPPTAGAASTAQPVLPAPAVQQAAAALPEPVEARKDAWYDSLKLRGYAQMRVSEIVSGDATAPPGRSRLRSVQDSGISDANNFSFRRIRLVVQGDVGDNVSIYLQPDFAVAVNNQSAGERREGFVQLRDAYVDWAFGEHKDWRLRFGQSKVPYGWENLQSSSNRLPLDRTDGINSAVPGERDLGITAYHTPRHVQRIWDRLDEDGQKLFGNYGAFALGAYNGQGTNRTETNNSLMIVAMATWPFELDGLGSAFEGQVLELGGSAMLNQFQPELRSGGISQTAFDDNRVVVHAILYPQPFGIQAEWNWGRGPEFDPVTNSITEKPLSGGYIQPMFRVRSSPVGPFMPFARWQHYRGGWKGAVNTPRLETDEYELGVEFQPIDPLELTLSYSHMKRREADERRTGRAEGDVLRAQLQWNY
jgi:hypothetical protein